MSEALAYDDYSPVQTNVGEGPSFDFGNMGEALAYDDYSSVKTAVGEGPSFDVSYSPIFDIDSILGKATETPQMQQAPEVKSKGVGDMLKEVEGWAKENPNLAKFLTEGGAGLLKSLGQQEALKEQREWLEKQDQMKWDRTMSARKFAPIEKKQQTGLLATLQATKERKAAQ